LPIGVCSHGARSGTGAGSSVSCESIPSACARCNLAGMEQDDAPRVDLSRLPDQLNERAKQERAAGGYPDDLSGVELEKPDGAIIEGFDLQSHRPRVRFRPELGFSSKPVFGPAITLAKPF